MPNDFIAGQKSISPPVSGRASPNPRATRRADEANLKNDKGLRKYAAGVDKALASFEPHQQEWADYIAFLARLLKAIQNVKQTDVIPHASQVALRLAQCLKPSLPSGVHQKAIEVYSCIFDLLGKDHLSRDLQTFLPGLLPVLSFASLTVRPLFYTLLEDYIFKLDGQTLRPALKSVILSLLPGIEDETSEDFERGIAALDALRTAVRSVEGPGTTNRTFHADSFFWQCIFLSVISGAGKRLGSLAFLTRRLPQFQKPIVDVHQNDASIAPLEIEAVIRPDAGLLLRCFAAGLRDENILVQRGFLDLLVTHLPLRTALLQDEAQASSLDLLVEAAIGVVLRRDMSLNRRLWSWYLGPEAQSAENGGENVKTPASELTDFQSAPQAAYFQSYGMVSLERCILSMFKRAPNNAMDAARPFRICAALMDRWEIGGYLVPLVFVPSLKAAHRYTRSINHRSNDDVLKSASLFFDGIESSLIWSQIINEISTSLDHIRSEPTRAIESLDFLHFVVSKFNIREEDMLVTHIPRAALVLLQGLSEVVSSGSSFQSEIQGRVLDLIYFLLLLLPEHALRSAPAINGDLHDVVSEEQCSLVAKSVKKSAREFDQMLVTPTSAVASPTISALLCHSAATLYQSYIQRVQSYSEVTKCGDMLSILLTKTNDVAGVDVKSMLASMESTMNLIVAEWSTGEGSFPIVASILLISLDIGDAVTTKSLNENLENVSRLAMQYLWRLMSPNCPKHHVEATRLLWKIHRASASTRGTVRLDAFVTQQLLDTGQESLALARFMTLWDLTLQNHQSRSDRKGSAVLRRASSFASIIDVSGFEAERTLARPLRILLDDLESGQAEMVTMILAWLGHLPSLDRILSALLTDLEIDLADYHKRERTTDCSSRSGRSGEQSLLKLQCAIDHLISILRHGTSHTWSALRELRSHDNDEEKQTLSGTQFLAKFAMSTTQTVGCCESLDLQRRLLRLLEILANAPDAFKLQSLHLEDAILTNLMAVIEQGVPSLQIEYLTLLSKVLSIRETPANEERPTIRSSDGQTRTMEAAPLLAIDSEHVPPSKLFECIKLAIKSPSTQQHLEHWMSLLSDILPLYSQSIFGEIIPLVEVLCSQINKTFQQIRFMALNAVAPVAQSPISSLSSLLHGLELVLASAHGNLSSPISEQPSARPAPSPQSFFGAGVNILSPTGNQSRTAKSNSRLTVILCLHDAIQICFRMWSWASYGSDTEASDPSSVATTTSNALKLRNRTKKILDNLVSAEGLECLEMLAVIWTKAKTRSDYEVSADSVLSVLNVLTSSRPRSTMPLILNALYSRTNIDALDSSKRSSLTCDLTPLDVAGFLLQYVQTIEDDALDEIWTDCMTFLRDVLANPMPHRQVLPAFLELIALLAEKIDNTNFGELQKMHRELADLFSRLLTASFTVRPAGGAYETTTAKSRAGIHPGDLFTSLVNVTPKLQTILESKDRVLATVNNLTTYVVNPTFHAKSFPDNVKPALLDLILLLPTQSPDAKLWRREVNDAFNDVRIFSVAPDMMQMHWFSVLRKWSLAEKEIVPEILSHITTPSTATLMFGVGANSARASADRTTQLSLRRIALLLLANDRDALMTHIPSMIAKLSELCTATLSSAPSSTTRADLFMLSRALLLAGSDTHLSPLWPTLTSTLYAALLSALPDGPEQETHSNLSLLQACKLLDLLAVLQPDDFQLQEWIFTTNTIDAVYTGTSASTAVVDEVAEALASSSTMLDAEKSGVEAGGVNYNMEAVEGGKRRPVLAGLGVDAADAKAMVRADFVRGTLLPFFAGLSIAAYEGAYAMVGVDWEVCRGDLMRDLMDEGTVV